MKFILLFLVFCLTDAKLLRCEFDVCTFSGNIEEPVNMVGPLAVVFDANTTHIGKYAFRKSNITSAMFNSIFTEIDEDAFDLIASVSLVCDEYILRSKHPLANVDAEYMRLRDECN